MRDGSTALVDYNGPRPPDEEIIDEREKITGKRVRYITARGFEP